MSAFATREATYIFCMATIHLRHIQFEKFNRLLTEVWERNSFYTHKWCAAGVQHHRIRTLDQLADFPFTTRDELIADQSAKPPLGTNLTYPWPLYKRVHKSSGTSHAPIFWGDTMASWRWITFCSQQLLAVSGVTVNDRILFILNPGVSSGPSIMYEAACQFGCGCFLAAPQDLAMQLKFLRDFSPTVLLAAPNELFLLAKFAEQNGIAPPKLSVSKIISFGNFEAVRQHAREVWHAEVFDRYGMTEAGSIASECAAHSGMHLLENEFIAEVIDPQTGKPVEEGMQGELVLTNLGRAARPIIRYRTGDLVRMVREHYCSCGRKEALLTGGVSRIVRPKI